MAFVKHFWGVILSDGARGVFQHPDCFSFVSLPLQIYIFIFFLFVECATWNIFWGWKWNGMGWMGNSGVIGVFSSS